MSEWFEVGDTVWEAFAYVNGSGHPVSRVRRAVVELSTDKAAKLLRYEDGRAEFFYPSPSSKACRSQGEAVAHCIAVFTRQQRDLQDAIDRLRPLADETAVGPNPMSGIASAGAALPEVAT